MKFKFEIGEEVYIKNFFSCYDSKIGKIEKQVSNYEQRKGKKVNAYTVKFENDSTWLFTESEIRRIEDK